MAGRIDLDKRRLHRRESDEHVVGCPTCSTVKLPSATTARAACEIAGVDPSTFAFRDGRLIDEEREHYSTVAAQAATLVLAARLRGRASNTDMVDVLGRAFSRTYRHAIAETPARSIREMTVPRAKTIRTELEHAGIDLAGLRKATDVTRVYTIERIDTVTPHGGRAGRRVVEQIAEYARKLEERLDAASWLPTLGDASSADEQDDDDQAEVEGEGRYRVLAEQKYEVVESGPRAKAVMDFLEQGEMLLDVAKFREDFETAKRRRLELVDELTRRNIPITPPLTKDEVEARHILVAARAKKLFPRGNVKAKRAKWRRETISLVTEHARCAAIIATADAVEIPAGRDFITVSPTYDRTINRRFQPMTFGPAAVSNKKRPPFGERLRSRWFRSTTGQPFIEEDVSSSQTQVLAYLLGDKDLEQIASTQSFNGYLAQRAWRDYERGSLKFKALIIPGDKYTGPDDSRLRALVKETWMRTLYGSQPYSIVKDQRNNQDEVGQGWDISNLKLFLETVPGWKTVNTFLNACQAIGMRDDIKYGGVTFHDPFDRAKVRWHPAARTEKSVTANSTSGGFMFYIDAPTYPMEGGEFHVDDLKMRNCVAPRLVHMLDAALNALVIERLATVAKPGLTFAAIHDAWVLAPWGDAAVDLTKAPVEFIDELAGDDYIPIWPDEDEEDGRPIWVDVAGEVMSDDLVVRGKLLLRRALDEAAKDWFESLDPVYDDLIRYLDDTEFSAFAHKIKARWERRLADCRAGRAKWPQFRLG